MFCKLKRAIYGTSKPPVFEGTMCMSGFGMLLWEKFLNVRESQQIWRQLHAMAVKSNVHVLEWNGAWETMQSPYRMQIHTD